nr:MAG TPA: hypothetical protein [Caudoviricetes sp.]
MLNISPYIGNILQIIWFNVGNILPLHRVSNNTAAKDSEKGRKSRIITIKS